MNKRITLLLTVLTFGFAITSQAQKFSGLDKSPADIATYPSSYQVADKAIKIVYSRPQLKGRSLAQLAPSGKIWRTGANESVVILLSNQEPILSLRFLVIRNGPSSLTAT